MYFLYANPLKPETADTAAELASLLIAAGKQVVLDQWLHGMLRVGIPGSLDSLTEDINAVIALGGDGTLLRVVHPSASRNIPMLGINLGRVGFLLETDPGGLRSAAHRLVTGDYYIEERMMMDAALKGEPPVLVMNDVVLCRGANPSSITVDVVADGELVYSTRGDGVIVATPTGSTAYCLSAGGPVLYPKMSAMVVLPICTHKAQQLPVVLDGHVRMQLRAHPEPGRSHQLILDGQTTAERPGEIRVDIQRSQTRAQFIRFEEQRFFTRLRLKQAEWSGK